MFDGKLPIVSTVCSQDVVCGVLEGELISVFNSYERSITVLMRSKDLRMRQEQTGVLCSSRHGLAKGKPLVIPWVV